VDFRLLGPLEVAEGDRILEPGRGRPRALLAILLLRANQVVSTERLIDDLWAGEAPPTAPKMVQMYVVELRKALADDVLATVSPGYVLRVSPGELDLDRFERLVERARSSEPAPAASLLRQALALWRGPALAEFAYEPWAQTEIARLEELRLVALEDRFDADLASGRAAEIVGELEALAREHPFRDRLSAQLMIALYRAGRQADALRHYRDRRAGLLDELGLEPSPVLQRLERAILTQDSSLDLPVVGRAQDELAPAERSILVVPQDEYRLAELVALAAPLASSAPARELIVARMVPPADSEAIGRANAELSAQRDDLVGRGLAVRVAVFTSPSPGEDIARLACDYAVDLVLTDVPRGAPLGDDVAAVVAAAPCDIALHVGEAPRLGPQAPVLVPFGGAEHDWAALELGAWISRAHGVGLTLLGSASRNHRRDASRLLADASLLVQKTAGVVAEPVVVKAGVDELVAAAGRAGLLVIGLSERWREEGVGPFRLALVERSPAPVLLVRRGPRPGGLAPAGSRTRYTWSLADASSPS
jgi:DNA-binding SARP family transcriptional activator